MKINYKLIEKKNRPIKIMQFGEGNFLRCFVDWIVNRMNKSRCFNSDVVVVQPLEKGRVRQLQEQEGLYTVILEGIKDKEVVSKKEIVDCLKDFINPYLEYDKFLKYAESSDLEYIVSNTTEAGIVLDKNDLDFEKCPNSFPSKLLAFLKKRYDYFDKDINKGLHILPCELIDNNGDKLKSILNKLAIMKSYDDEFIEWLNKYNYFYNTLVDRIVPGYPYDMKEEYEKILGYEDDFMVKGELFHLWVIEDKYGLRNKLNIRDNDLNVSFVSDIKDYNDIKVKVLNGAHTCIFSIAYMYGINTIYQSVNNEYILKFLKTFLYDEVKNTLSMDDNVVNKYIESTIERFNNPFIKHNVLDISLNSLTKFKTRLYDTILRNLNNKIFCKCALFSYASLIAFYLLNEDKIKDNEEYLKEFCKFRKMFKNNIESAKEIVISVLKMPHFEIDLSVNEEVVDYMADCLLKIFKNGMKETLEDFCSGL